MKNFCLTQWPDSLVALYRAMRLRFGYGFESCDANGPRNVRNTNVAKHRALRRNMPLSPIEVNIRGYAEVKIALRQF